MLASQVKILGANIAISYQLYDLCLRQDTSIVEPEHDVFLSTYLIDKYEVRNGQYRAFMAITGASPVFGTDAAADDGGGDEFPVMGITWELADEYCRWVGKPLPTEAEWEKVAHGAAGHKYPCGDTIDRTRANYSADEVRPTGQFGDSTDGYWGRIPVGTYPAGASPYGLLDMAGNVSEWVSDWWDLAVSYNVNPHSDYYGVSPPTDPKGPASGERHVVRGGTYFDPPEWVATALRGAGPNADDIARDDNPERGSQHFGMRCAWEPWDCGPARRSTGSRESELPRCGLPSPWGNDGVA
jgi:formylglycine-generating enzyme required for sulfatase activity